MFLGNILTNPARKFNHSERARMIHKGHLFNPECAIWICVMRVARVGAELRNWWISQSLMRGVTFFCEKARTETRLEISFSHIITAIDIIYIHYLWKNQQFAVRGLFLSNILLSSLIVSSHMQLLPSMKKNHHLIGANLQDGRRRRRRRRRRTVTSGRWSE